ncbi:thioesterase II family protein [Kribbella sp. NPDC056345]|uniref:thioesterase II family protein n=1 Tax=Kribbella sp. NPDC056345 TaxID=3345789 RepID=UPI0035D7B95F
METTRTDEAWFVFPPRDNATADLFCLPHSGGGATAYRSWLEAFPAPVAVRPVQLPGRESRMGEKSEIDVGRIAEVVSSGGRPFALYGHSFGALLAFEVTRELHRRELPLPERLFLGACRPPWLAAEHAIRLGGLGDEEFVDAVMAMGGTAWDLRSEPELLAYLLRGARGDFEWMAAYRYVETSPLPVPVVAIAGTEDPLAPADELAGWSVVTSAGFALHTVPGGHFFAQHQVDLTIRCLISHWPGRPEGLS